MDAGQFLEEFGHIASAQGGVQRLRELIYHLAINGDLVSSYPSNEATEILEAIKWLKKNHEESKKVVSGQKEVSATEILVPKNWVKCRLGDLVLTITGGGTPSKSNPLYWNGDIPWASVKDLGNKKFLSSTLDKITSDGLINSSSNLIPVNRVIICTRMGLGKIVINTIPLAINQDLKALELPPEVNIHFFLILYKTRPIIGKGTTVSGIRQNILLEIPAVIPALEEQKRIVAKVDELMNLCDKLEAQQQKRSKLKRLTCTTLLDALANAQSPYELKAAWQRVQGNIPLLFGEQGSITELKNHILQLASKGCLNSYQIGDSPIHSTLESLRAIQNEEFSNREKKELKILRPPEFIDDFHIKLSLGHIVKVVSGQHLSPGEYNENHDGIPYITGPAEFGVSHPKPTKWTHEKRAVATHNDILVTVKGSGVGKTSLCNVEELAISRQLMAIRAIGSVNKGYLAICVDAAKSKFQDLKMGIAIPGIGRTDVLTLELILPSIEEQERVFIKTKRLLDICAQLEKYIEKSESTAQQLSQSAISAITQSDTENRGVA